MIPIGTRVIVMRHKYYLGHLGVIVDSFGGSYLVKLDDAPPTWIPHPQIDVLRLPEDDEMGDVPCC